MISPEVTQFGDRAVLIKWPERIDPTINQTVLNWSAYLQNEFRERIEEVVVAYCSLVVYLKPQTAVSLILEGIQRLEVPQDFIKDQHWHYTLPVCYQPKYAMDQGHVVEHLGISVDELIKWHTSSVYRVYFIGFLPGFPYLGGLDKRLHLPRRSEPRAHVPSGAVGIGGQQTGIYPQQSPGGWNLIGNCPVPLFQPEWEQPSLLRAGDTLCFRSVSVGEFDHIKDQIERSAYTVIKEAIHD